MDAAAIAGSPAAVHYGCEILKQSIETNPKNYTRFYVISREENADVFRSASKVNRASMTFIVPDKPGALFAVLDILQKHGMNMKKLESRPILGKPWEYSFFVESELNDEHDLSDLVPTLKENTVSFRILGTYTAAH